MEKEFAKENYYELFFYSEYHKNKVSKWLFFRYLYLLLG